MTSRLEELKAATDAMKAIEWLLKSPDGQVLYGNAVDSDGFLYPDVIDSLSNAYKILDTYQLRHASN